MKRLPCLLLFLWLAACEFVSPQPVPTALPTAVPLPTAIQTATPTAVPTLPPLPTLPAVPTATPNPALADWTILIYMAADNTLASASLLDLNEMEAAPLPDNVQVIVQLDDGQTRRLRIQPDDDPTAVSSPVLAEMGTQNMGSPDTLRDFIAWGTANYPANHTALILWNHGAGWQGIATDNSSADQLTLPELADALTPLAQPFDLLGFDACLMAQLELFAGLSSVAQTAVASPALTPGTGWDYTAWLTQLANNPRQDGAALAKTIVQTFAAYYAQSDRDDFVTITAVSLPHIPRLTAAIDHLAEQINTQPTLLASAVSDARSGAAIYSDPTLAADTTANPAAAIDLGRFAAIFAQRSPDPLAAQAAEQITQALAEAILAHEAGSGFRQISGVAINLPATPAGEDANYRQMTTLTGWHALLDAYWSGDTAASSPPALTVVTQPERAGMQQPAYFAFEIAGRGVQDVVFLASQSTVNGRRLLEYNPLIPEPTYLPDGSTLSVWRDGVHEDFYIWRPEATWLFDESGEGDFVVMLPVSDEGRFFAVQGIWQPLGGTAVSASLVFDQQSGQQVRLWAAANENSTAVAEAVPQPGDTFQLLTPYLQDDGTTAYQPGAVLHFGAAGTLAYEWRPLPDGDYEAGFLVRNGVGETAVSLVPVTLDNSHNQPGVSTYLDPYLGFQFNYPDTWYTPVYSDTLLYTRSRTGDTQLAITLYPQLAAGSTAENLAASTLDAFGDVAVLYRDELVVAGTISGKRVVYGYTHASGTPHTGVFLAFVHDGVGYVVDVDAPSDEETAVQEALATIATSWQFAQPGFGLHPGNWARLDLAAFSVPQPTDFVYQPTESWQRFTADAHTFVALRFQPQTRPAADVMAALLRDAGTGIADFSAEPARRVLLGGALWLRTDFSYTAEDGTEIWGYIMVKLDAGQEVVAWVEAPANSYNDLETAVFLPMIADLDVKR